jgi:hypothetical protein
VTLLSSADDTTVYMHQVKNLNLSVIRFNNEWLNYSPDIVQTNVLQTNKMVKKLCYNKQDKIHLIGNDCIGKFSKLLGVLLNENLLELSHIPSLVCHKVIKCVKYSF